MALIPLLWGLASAVNLSELRQKDVCIENDYVPSYSNNQVELTEFKLTGMDLLIDLGFKVKDGGDGCPYSIRPMAINYKLGVYDTLLTFVLIPLASTEAVKSSWTLFLLPSETFEQNINEGLKDLSLSFLKDWQESHNK